MYLPNTIIYYESTCPFCNVCRVFIEKRDTHKHFIFRDTSLYESEKKEESAVDGSIVVVQDKVHYQRFLACRKIAEKMNSPWPPIGYLLGFIPQTIGDWGYDWVANHRPILMNLYKVFQ